MSGRRPPMFLATDRRMMQLSAAVRERRRQHRLAYTFDPGLQIADEVVRRSALDRLAAALDLPPGYDEVPIMDRTMPEPRSGFAAPTGERHVPTGWPG